MSAGVPVQVVHVGPGRRRAERLVVARDPLPHLALALAARAGRLCGPHRQGSPTRVAHLGAVAVPTALLHARDAGHQLLARQQQHVLVQRPVLPPALGELAGDQQGRLGTGVGQHQLADHRVALALGYRHGGTLAHLEPGHGRPLAPYDHFPVSC